MKLSRKMVVCALSVLLSAGAVSWLSRKAEAERGHAALPQRLSLPSEIAALMDATITVNSNSDVAVGGDGKCTLREAITNANNNSQLAGSIAGDCPAGMIGADIIKFNSPMTINLGSPLPPITEAAIIDGFQGSNTCPALGLPAPATMQVVIKGGGVLGLRFGVASGGPSVIRGLVIQNFGGVGVQVNSPNAANFLTCECNYIGTDVTGTANMGNGGQGFGIIGSPGNIVRQNLISGNNQGGIFIDGTSAVANKISGNYIGTDITGTAALANGDFGVFISAAPNNTVGGTTVGERNLISGNNGHGVEITGEGTTGNKVTGNYIGTDVTGTADLGNGGNGVYIVFAKDNTIGGTVAGARNVISGNDGSGITIQDFRTTGNQVLGNFIGTDVTGTVALGNRSFGVFLFVTEGNIIGGTQASARNIISGNESTGVVISTGQKNKVLGNFIGTNVTGTAALSNSNGGVAIGTSGANEVVSNVISGNHGDGVVVFSSGPVQLSDNLIGLDVTGALNLGNSLDGIRLVQAFNNVIGGAAAGNTIAFNGGSGVAINNYAFENAVLSNSIFANTGLGIDLGPYAEDGVTPNDPGDSDTGSNNLQNFPVLTCAISANGQTTIQGSLNSLANTSFRIEFFANDACDPSGNGEGQTFLGFQNVTTVGNDAPINATLPVAVAAGKLITATATRLDAMNNPVETSEFSACRAVPAPTLTINDVSVAEGNAGTVNAVFTVTLSGAQGTCLPVTVNFATADNTATTVGNDYTATAGTLVFNTPIASNSVTQTITVQVKGDTNVEANETFFVNLSGAVNATLSDSQGVGTILDDDFLRVQTGDPLICLGPAGVVNVTATVTNPNAAPAAFTFTATLPAQLLALPGTCTTNVAGTACTAANAAAGTLNPGQTVTINYQAQVADGTLPGTQLCISSTAIIGGVTAAVTACVTVNCPAVGPGSVFPAASEVSDQKTGSVLVYNLYSSSTAAPNAQNTRIAITNTHPQLPIAVHLFFVDGATCSIADSLVCLTPNQTASFLASDIDPGTTGYIVAVASDRVTGCPVNFNYLIGDAYVKLAGGHAANLTAESFAALAGGLTTCDANSVTVQLNFDGVSYNRAPRVLAASNIPSRADGNDTLIVLNRLGGSLASGAATLGSIFGILYDDAENPLSFTFIAAACQFRGSLRNSFPRTAPPFENFIQAGHSGWARLYSLADIGLLGAQLNFNTQAGTSAQAFNQGHNLHKLSLTTAAALTVPIFPPNC